MALRKRMSQIDKMSEILLFMDTHIARLKAGKTYKTSFTAKEIAEALNYKSAVSVRAELYKLADSGQINLYSSLRGGCVQDACLFSPKGYKPFGENMQLWGRS